MAQGVTHSHWAAARRNGEEVTGEGVDGRVRFRQADLVGVDEDIDDVREAVAFLFAFPGTDETVAEDAGAMCGAPGLRLPR